MVANVRIGVTGPGYIHIDRQGRAERPPALVGDDDPQFPGDELRAQVIGVAADSQGEAALSQHTFHDRAQVGHEAVVAGHQLVKLAASRDVLVLKTVRLAQLDRPQGRPNDLLVDGGQLLLRPWEKAGQRSEAVSDAARPGGL